MPDDTTQDTVQPVIQEWAALFYLCGHFNRTGDQDPFVSALDEIQEVGGSIAMSAAVYLDLESGAQRVALRHGEEAESEFLGAVNSGDPETLEQFLLWAFDACPARRYLLVMAGLGIMDSDSVVGRPPFDAARLFAICDDRATNDAIELHELSATLKAAFPPDGPRSLVLLACDMYAMQFMEVCYELRGVLDLILGIQPDDRENSGPLPHWPYARCLRRWQELVANPAAGDAPRWRSTVDPQGLVLAKESVLLLADHYSSTLDKNSPVTVSAIDLEALVPVAQALDTFSVVYLQWLSNDVIWRAREMVVKTHAKALEQSWSYDLNEVAMAILAALKVAASEAVVRWAADAVPGMPYPSLSRTLRVMSATARKLGATGPRAEAYRRIANEIAACRAGVERLLAVVADETPAAKIPEHAGVDASVRALFSDPAEPERVRDPDAWEAIIEQSRDRFTGAAARELADALDGIEAAKQLGRLANRVSDLVRGETPQPAIVAVWPPKSRCGLALYRPVDLDRLAESNYLELRFSRDLHWTALLTAVDLIKHHARMLWRLVESQLTAAPLEARYQLMRRLAGDRALTGRHANQLRALSAPDALFLTIDPADDDLVSTAGASDAAHPRAQRRSDDPILTYCVRLSSLDRSATVVERRNQITRSRLDKVLEEIGNVGGDVDAQPVRTLQRLARCGSLLGDDVLFGISDHLADLMPSGDRAVHLVLQMPRALMRYPWELLRDRHGWLVDRFAIGRQVITESGSAPRWSANTRQGPLRLLVVAPSVPGTGTELAGAGALEGLHVADCFARLLERLPGVIDPSNHKKHVDQPVTVEEFRSLLRSRKYDIVHFAGHGRYDSVHPERSCWMFTDGPFYAFELQQTLANAEVRPWLIYGSACEGARDGGSLQGYHDGVYGMASAALSQGVAAYVGPLWKISDTDAKNMAAAFYEALLIRRTSLGEALALARRSVREGQPDLDELVVRSNQGGGVAAEPSTPRSAGWAGMVLYGDPTPTVLQRLSPSDTSDSGRRKAAPVQRPRSAESSSDAESERE
ncbi:MAG: CHAT domain-containing protein [Vicinamibacterales bacterium]